MKKLVTHDGSFHSDDVFACAALSILLKGKGESYEIIRTRDENLIASGDYVFDVGGAYDEAKNRFDHHQRGGAGKRENGIEYASFGLVWKKFGEELSGSPEAAEAVDRHLVAPIDAFDNGIELTEDKEKVYPYLIQNIFVSMEPTWRETDRSKDEMFKKSADLAEEILEREITHARDSILATKAVAAIYENTPDKRVMIFDQDYPSDLSVEDLPETFYIVYPRSDVNWGARSVRQGPHTFKNRKDLPAAWGGLRNEDMAKASGVPDAIFCHRALFMAVARSKEGAIKLAQLALEN